MPRPLPWLFWAADAARIGIVTMHSPEIMSYANTTSLMNQRYAERHSYGYHILDHTIDTARVPHWSKIHAILMHLPDYDFVFWIDADAVFYDQSRRIEDALNVEEKSELQIWGQDMWPDYPSLHRKEIMDGGTFLVRNSLWTRRFFTELYFYPPCQEFLNFTEQFCFSVAFEANLLEVKQKTKILPTPTINHHRLPPPGNSDGLFIWHLSGRSDEARERHFRLVYEDYSSKFQNLKYQSFWLFYQLFERQDFGSLASLQLCIFGIGQRQQAMMEAMMYHFPYWTGFVVTQQGAPGLFSQMRQSEEIGEKFGSRMAALDMTEYRTGKTRKGEEFIKGFFCDLLVLSPESWRHLAQGAQTLVPLIKAGLEQYEGPKGKGFGYSGLQDVLVVLVSESCKLQENFQSGNIYTAEEGAVLDSDDPNGDALNAACDLMSDLQLMVQHVYQGAQDEDAPDRYLQMVLTPHPDAGPRVESVLPDSKEDLDEELPTIPWDRLDTDRWGIEGLGSVTLARLPRFAFPS